MIAFAALSSIIFSTLLLSLRAVDNVPFFVTAVLVALAIVAAWRPATALLIVGAVVPIASWIGRTWNGYVAWPETLAVAFAAGYAARGLRGTPPTRDALQLPVLFFSAVVLASLAVHFVVLHWTIGGEALLQQLIQLATADYFVSSGRFRELDAAMRLIEGMVLLRAASSVALANPGLPPLLVRWFVVGAAAAGALNLWRIWQGAMRSEMPVAQFFEYLATIRYNVHYGDVNAAGSYFVMALLAAVGLLLATRHFWWFPALVLIGTSLLLSGSRTAFVAGGTAALLWVGQSLARGRKTGDSNLLLVAASVLLIAGTIAGALSLISSRSAAPSAAFEIRAELARTTFRMVGTRPVFGIGVGQYQDRSSTFSTPQPIQTFRLQSENAHNNFLQVLGELGLAGLAGLLWVLAAAACVRHIRRSHGSLITGVGAGVLAFVLTWLTGHPMLIDEPALLFWLTLGTAAGWDTNAAPAAGWWRRAATAGTLALAVAVISVPFRAHREFADTDLEHRGIGLSLWQHGEDGVRYRLAGSQSTIFVPADARTVTVPLRGVGPDQELHVALRLNGRRANVVRVPADQWYGLHLLLPPDGQGSRYHRLELRVAGQPPGGAVLMVGKVQRR